MFWGWGPLDIRVIDDTRIFDISSAGTLMFRLQGIPLGSWLC